MRNKWTPEDDKVMTQMLDNGATYQEVAEKLGRTKNSCIGRGHRLGLMEGIASIIDARRARQPKKKERPAAIVIPFPAKPRYPQPEASTTPFGREKTLLELTSNECRFAVADRHGQHLFCAGDRRPGSPYCAEHHGISYRKTARQLTKEALYG